MRDRHGLEVFVAAHLEGTAGPADARRGRGRRRRAARDDVARCLALDERARRDEAVPEFRDASRQMGRQTLRVAAALDADAVSSPPGAAPSMTVGRPATTRSCSARRSAAAGAEPERAAARLSLLDRGAAGRRRPPAPRARSARGPARARRDAAADRAPGRGGGDGDRRTISGASTRPRARGHAVTRRSTRGYSAHEHDPRSHGRSRSASAAPSARARPRWPRRSAGGCATSWTWRSSPTTSTRRRTPSSWCAGVRCRRSASWASRPAAARTRPSAKTPR